MGLSALDCPRCGRWDDDGEYPMAHGSRAIEIVEKGKKIQHTDICDKCFEELKAKGGRVFYMKEVIKYVKVYAPDPKVEYGSVKNIRCPSCYQHYDPKTYTSCPFAGTEYHKKLEAGAESRAK